jgi:hypothetical protein
MMEALLFYLSGVVSGLAISGFMAAIVSRRISRGDDGMTDEDFRQ